VSGANEAGHLNSYRGPARVYNQRVNQKANAEIVESFLEHRQLFDQPWTALWVLPNPLIEPVFRVTRSAGVTLNDIAFNKDAKSVGETYLNVSVSSLNAAIQIGLDGVTFKVANPDWGMAPKLVPLFDDVSAVVKSTVQQSPVKQEVALAFHVTQGEKNWTTRTRPLVDQGIFGPADFYGVAIHRTESSLLIDKSLRHENSAFFRLSRTFSGEVPFVEIAKSLYDDELKALQMVGINGID
jgi:hypothetical protein